MDLPARRMTRIGRQRRRLRPVPERRRRPHQRPQPILPQPAKCKAPRHTTENYWLCGGGSPLVYLFVAAATFSFTLDDSGSIATRADRSANKKLHKRGSARFFWQKKAVPGAAVCRYLQRRSRPHALACLAPVLLSRVGNLFRAAPW